MGHKRTCGQNSRPLQFFDSRVAESKPNGIFVPLAGVLADEFTDSSASTFWERAEIMKSKFNDSEVADTSDLPLAGDGGRRSKAKRRLLSATGAVPLQKHSADDKFFTFPDVAELLVVSDRTVRRWVKGKKLVAHQFGGATRISAIELSGFITRARRGPTAPLQPRNPLADQFYTAEDIAEILNVSKRTVFRYVRSNMLIAHKFGRATRIADSDLRDFIERSRAG